MYWIDTDADFQIENLPEISIDGKMSFIEWLKVQGITPENWDENYSGTMATEIEEQYTSYYYGGIPQFVINKLEWD